MDLVITVKEVKGHCPVHKAGDSFTLKACYQLVSDIPVCMHGLASLMPWYNGPRPTSRAPTSANTPAAAPSSTRSPRSNRSTPATRIS